MKTEVATTRDLIKNEVDRVPEERLEVLYRIVLALEDTDESKTQATGAWSSFVAETYGCMADAPIERPEVGWYEDREVLEPSSSQRSPWPTMRLW